MSTETSPELKAKELVDKFRPYMYCYMGSGMLSNDYDENVETDNAKYCALLCVDEIIKSSPYNPNNKGIYEHFEVGINQAIEYWNKVREAIINL